MKTTDSAGHLKDEALLLLSAGELGHRTALRLSKHLQNCPSCRQRQEQLQEGESQLQGARHTHQHHAPDPARTRLQASLLAATKRSPRQTSWFGHMLQPVALVRVAVLLALCILAATYRQASRPLQDLMGAFEETGPEPNRHLTPGSARALSVAEVCSQPDHDLDPKLPPEKQRAVFQAYRMSERASRAYQVDYLINPQLGGDDSLANLWPEPYHATLWNAAAKDALEMRLHSMVCNGDIDLRSAQHELADDWISAYKKYFHTNRPVSTVAAVSLQDVR